MLNNVVLVGRLTKNPEIVETKNGNKVTNIIIAVPKSYKNSEGVYDTDFIKITLWNIVAEHTAEYCVKGDVVGIKGRIESNNYEKDGVKKYETVVVGERITFLSSKNNPNIEDEKEVDYER